jgi:acyl-CoA hydrolase
LPELGGNRIHVSEVDAWVEYASEPVALPSEPSTPEDEAIARNVADHIGDGATLQFGIGPVPNEIARILARGALGEFGIHTEMISDGVMELHRAGKIANRKGLYDGFTIGTFALGSAELYRWLDGNPEVRILPVSAVNDPALLRRLERFVSVNAALAIDLRGQVAADHIRGAQYSGIGGHESFVMGATEARGGKSFLCLKSTVLQGEKQKRISTIVPRLPETMTVTTPRHHVQWVVTEHGAVDLSLLTDRQRAGALLELAHPSFRDELGELAAA